MITILSASVGAIAEAYSLDHAVSGADIAYAEHKHSPRDARRALAGRAALRLLVAAHWGLPASDAAAISVDRGCSHCGGPHGRPRVRGLAVSTSSSGNQVMAAVGPEESHVGIDVEKIPHALHSGFDQDVAHPDEPALHSNAERVQLWTRKEAVLKAAGLGLMSPPHQVRLKPMAETFVPLLDSDEQTHHAPWHSVMDAESSELMGMSVRDVFAEPSYCGAVAVASPLPVKMIGATDIFQRGQNA